MFHASPLANVNLAWANNLVYTNIVVQRNDEVLARLGEDQVSYTDKIPPDGLWTYSVVPENGNCDRATVVVRVQEAGYPQLVIGRITGYLNGNAESEDAAAETENKVNPSTSFAGGCFV